MAPGTDVLTADRAPGRGTTDEATVEEHGLGNLRFGDLVAIMDADHAFGRIYRQGAVSIGVIVHGECVTAGHGPGVTTLLTSVSGALAPTIDRRANIAQVLGLRKERPRTNRKPEKMRWQSLRYLKK